MSTSSVIVLRAPSTTKCRYHNSLFSNLTKNSEGNKGIMDRFLAEGPQKEPAVFIRPDTDKPSIDKACTCIEYAEYGSKRPSPYALRG